MNNGLNYTQEELEAMLEKAKADLQAKLDSMSPEERRQAELNAQKAIAADREWMDNLIAEANSVLNSTQQTGANPSFCPHCGAPAGGGNFCTYCGGALR